MVLLDCPHFECLITFVSTFAILVSKQENSVDQVTLFKTKRANLLLHNGVIAGQTKSLHVTLGFDFSVFLINELHAN